MTSNLNIYWGIVVVETELFPARLSKWSHCASMWQVEEMTWRKICNYQQVFNMAAITFIC